MKKFYTKLFSIFTIILLSFGMITNAADSANLNSGTSTPDDTITIYFDNSYTKWDDVNLYYFGNASNNWPGDPMKKEASGKYSIKIPKKASSIIFNNNGKGIQSTDISNISDNDEYVGIQTTGGKILMIKKVDGKIPDVPATGDKTPMQINTHISNNYSTVNLTYTTQGPATSKLTLKDSNDDVINTFSGKSEFSYLSFKFNHVIQINNLKPETKYKYTIESDDKTVEGSFKTTSSANSSSTAKFAFLADCQVNNETDAKAFGATCNTLNNIKDLDLVYIAGDITNNAGNEKQFEQLFDNGGKYKNVCQDMFKSHLLAITQGNHDVSDFGGHITVPSASKDVGDDVYSFDLGKARLIVLNLETAKDNENIREAEKAYLEKEATEAKNQNKWIIVSFHKSIYTGASHIVDSDIIAARTYWSKILSDLNVDIVLEGHDHVYARGFVTNEGKNANLKKNSDGSYSKHDGSPLYMVGGHAGGLKWYQKIDYKVKPGDPLSDNYSFLDINSADPKYNSDGLTSTEKKEQFYTIFEISDDKISSKTYTLKYNTDKDEITKAPEEYDSITISRNSSTSTATGTATDTATETATGTNSKTSDTSNILLVVYGAIISLYLIGLSTIKINQRFPFK